LLLVWRETGAVRNARRSRGQAASTRKRAEWSETAKRPNPLQGRKRERVGILTEILDLIHDRGINVTVRKKHLFTSSADYEKED
jgi:hypothetical protein